MKNREQVIEAAIGVIARYGVKRTTMSDVAAEANIVRQTLYNMYANKEDLLRAMMRHIGEQSIASIRSEAQEAEGLAAKLDIFMLHFVIKPYEWLQSSPDAKDIVDGFNDAARDELAKSYQNHRVVLQELLAPYSDRIEQAGLKLPALADIIQTAAKGAKGSARDKRHLMALIKSLKIMVLSLVGEEPPGR
ncbi:TetR/AcrR family transcriptional regulator [Hoeflea sp.]|uniref:TetR/AcrR family transcriptional regulator n=1 Tax=Hoeflea sp. TaxID=1940281 RepID=UPI003B026E86